MIKQWRYHYLRRNTKIKLLKSRRRAIGLIHKSNSRQTKGRRNKNSFI